MAAASVSTQIVARLYPRIRPRRLMAAGLTGVATAMALLSLIGLESSTWVVRLLMFLIGVGMAYVFLPNQAACLATISSEATGRASTIFSVQRQLGAAIGVAKDAPVGIVTSSSRAGGSSADVATGEGSTGARARQAMTSSSVVCPKSR